MRAGRLRLWALLRPICATTGVAGPPAWVVSVGWARVRAPAGSLHFPLKVTFVGLRALGGVTVSHALYTPVVGIGAAPHHVILDMGSPWGRRVAACWHRWARKA